MRHVAPKIVASIYLSTRTSTSIPIFNLFLSSHLIPNPRDSNAQICHHKPILKKHRWRYATLVSFFKVPALGAPNSGKGGNPEGVAKNILEYVFAHIVEFKKVNQEVAIGGGGAGQQGEFDTNMERDFEG